jgi:hypothetical protein
VRRAVLSETYAITSSGSFHRERPFFTTVTVQPSG